MTLTRKILTEAFKRLGASDDHIDKSTLEALRMIDSGEMDSDLQKAINTIGYDATVDASTKFFAKLNGLIPFEKLENN